MVSTKTADSCDEITLPVRLAMDFTVATIPAERIRKKLGQRYLIAKSQAQAEWFPISASFASEVQNMCHAPALRFPVNFELQVSLCESAKK